MVKKKRIIGLISLAGIFFGILAGFFYSLIHDLPQINQLKRYKPSAATTIFSSDNHILTRFYIEKRFPVKITKVPESLINALITIEDRNFFSHSGINVKAIARAIVRDIQAGRFKQGASTLTQQLAKVLFLTNEKSIVRKIKEAILTLQIERRYTKNEILELYLNQIYLGSGIYGVEAAAQTYFEKSVSDISLDEAALIAGLPKAPSVYSPINNPEKARKRRNIVLYQMLATKRIDQTAYENAISKPVRQPVKHGQQNSSSYFNEYIKSVIRKQFDLKQVYSNGLNIQTTLRLDIQKQSNLIVGKNMAVLEERMRKNNLDTTNVQCALVAIDIKTGGIVSMVGGRDFNKSVYNRAVQAKRQPGSAFKPFVYAAGIVQGISQDHQLLDAPLSYRLENGQTWQVNNFSRNYTGELTCRKALALSKNTPVVRLIEQIGVEKVIAFAKNAGITSKLSPNLSLALGTSEVSLLELTASYIPFANLGIKVTPFSIIKITDKNSRLIYQHTIEKQSVLSRQHAALMTDMLKAVIREGTGKKARRIKKDIAGKTGTTDDYRDALFVGFSPDLALGVWVGNDNSTPLGNYETGAKAALPTWIDVMEYHLSQTAVQYFDIPDGLKMVYMDPDTGKLSKVKTSHSVKTLLKARD